MLRNKQAPDLNGVKPPPVFFTSCDLVCWGPGRAQPGGFAFHMVARAPLGILLDIQAGFSEVSGSLAGWLGAAGNDPCRPT